MRFRALSLAFVVVTAGGCGTSAQRGAALYGDGRYIEAAEVFERTEARLPRCDGDERAEYGLYRGLTFLRLDDVNSARQWLSYAASVERREPGSLSDDERRALARAQAEAERRAAEQPAPAPKVEAVAASDSALHLGTSANGRRSVRE